MNKKTISRVLLAIFILAVIISAGVLAYTEYGYIQGSREYSDISSAVTSERADDLLQDESTGADAASEETEVVRELRIDNPDDLQQLALNGAIGERAQSMAEQGVTIALMSEADAPLLTVDFDALSQQNAETVGWIDFPGQDISYPIVQADDNEKYLKLTFSGNKNAVGTIFLDSRNNGLIRDGNTIIYGHNMKNGSMFGRLDSYRSSGHHANYPFFDIYTWEGVYRCYIISAGQIKADGYHYQVSLESEEAIAEYADMITSTSDYEITPPDDLSGGAPLVQLSTCSGGYDYRYALLARVQKFYPVRGLLDAAGG